MRAKNESASRNSIVKLNIGGVKYLTTSETLLKSQNFFSGLLSGQVSSLLDDEGYYFVDRDGKLFGVLLDYMRTGRLRVPAGVDFEQVEEEARFYSLNLHAFAPLSDAALCAWLEDRQQAAHLRQWQRYPELEDVKVKILTAFRIEQEKGEGLFQFVFYPEIDADGGSVTRFISKLIAEDEVSAEHRKGIEACKNQLLRCDFTKHPYYPIGLSAWKVLGLPQCQALLSHKIFAEAKLSIDFKVSRIGVARVEKRHEVDGALFYMVHDFYALNGLDAPRALQPGWDQTGSVAHRTPEATLRQQFDRCVSAIQCFWSFKSAVAYNAAKSPKAQHRSLAEEMLPGSPPN